MVLINIFIGGRIAPAAAPKCNARNGEDSYIKRIGEIEVMAEGSEVFDGYRFTFGLDRVSWSKSGGTSDNPLEHVSSVPGGFVDFMPEPQTFKPCLHSTFAY